MQYNKLTTTFALLLALFSNGLLASEKHHDHDHKHDTDEKTSKHEQHEHERKQHDAHEHGAAKLSIAVDAGNIDIMLESPAANLVGFEHLASRDDDKQKLAAVKATLEAGNNLFSMNASANCQLKNTEIVSAQLNALHHHEHKEKHSDHDKHEHSEKQTDEKQHSHQDDHDQAETNTHSDMDITWSFTCTEPTKANEINVKLFSAFPNGFEHIKAEWITATVASSKVLNEDTTIRFK